MGVSSLHLPDSWEVSPWTQWTGPKVSLSGVRGGWVLHPPLLHQATGLQVLALGVTITPGVSIPPGTLCLP